MTLAILFLLATASVTGAHNGEAPPSPPSRPPTDVDIQEILPPRWSWIHWWEANRERYLRSPSQDDDEQKAGEAQLQVLRDAAASELPRSIQLNGNASLTAAASLAIGKIHDVARLDALKAVAAEANGAPARTAALVAIGLLGTPEAEAALVAFKPGRTDASVAAMAALGLLNEIQPQTLRQLRAATSTEDAALATAVCWSLRQHHQKLDATYYRNLLGVNESPWVASEALLGVGKTRDPKSLRALEDVLLGRTSAGTEVKAWQALLQMHADKLRLATMRSNPNYESDYENYKKRYELWEKRNPNRNGKMQGRLAKVQGGSEIIGPELIQLAALRSSAAIAIGELGEPRGADVLLHFLEPSPAEDEYLIAPKGFAIMALAAYPSDQSRDRFIALLGKQEQGGKLRLDGPRDGPLRGFAALALGLYAQPYDTPQGVADRVNYDWAIATLAERFEDDAEDQEVRAACALALGLSQRTAVLPVLHRLSSRLAERNRKQDMLLFGYALLARAMAGDRNVVEPAGKFLLTEDDTSPNGIMARRAAVLSLGVSRSSAAIPVLTKAWHLNHYVNREVILALRLVGGTSAATPVTQRLRESKDAEERAYMAEALGELLAAEDPTPLSRLTAQGNYTMRNDHLLPLQRLANPFLFDFLIAGFGEEW
ncbi:MAG: HEAT repeat domain-containing protein [Tepidisphaeraceae bacterium]